MKKIIAFVFLIHITALQAQDYLINDPSKIIDTEFENGIPDSLKDSFVNFDSEDHFENIDGLYKKNYTTTNAQNSSIIINQENIGRVVIYAKLFNKNDSILFNLFSKRKGDIKIKSFRKNVLAESILFKISFDEDFYQQIHFNTNLSGIDSVVIEFISQQDLFIIEKLKVIPYNNEGVKYYKNLEDIEKSILGLQNESVTIKNNYNDQIKKIQTKHEKLSALIIGEKFELLARTHSNSLNPFQNSEFKNHYNKILDKASDADKAQIQNLSADLGGSNFSNVAVILDNLFTGGKFSSVINTIDGLFSKTVNLKPEHKLPIIHLDAKYYFQEQMSNNKLRLVPVNDAVTKQIKELNLENKAYKDYIEKIVYFMKDDLLTLNELNNDILVAKGIQNEFEELIWFIMKDYTEMTKSMLIKDGSINFFDVGMELEKNFKLEKKDVATLNKIKSQSILSITKFNELSSKYDKITSKIKSHYDLIYEIRPKQRKLSFDSSSKLPKALVIDWKNSQDQIITDYTKSGGLKEFLGKE